MSASGHRADIASSRGTPACRTDTLTGRSCHKRAPKRNAKGTVKNAARIAKVPGIHGVFAASGDLGNFSGWQEGDAEYEKLITAIHDATLKAGKRLCGPFRWIDRPGFTCFQN